MTPRKKSRASAVISAPIHYDAIVIGSGQGGTPLCQALAKSGLRTALVESTHVGGTCVNEGCTPTKTMIASGRVAYLARRGADYGVRTGAIRIAMQRIRRRKRDIVNEFRSRDEQAIRKTPNLDWIHGTAKFTGPKSVEVALRRGGRRCLSADRIFLNTGCRPGIPDLPGLRDGPFLDSTSIMELGQVPEHLLVLGGGYIGLEFGQLFRRLGSRVTILQRGPALLAREDPDVTRAVAEIMRQDGIQVLLNTEAARVSRSGSKMSLDIRSSADAGAANSEKKPAARSRTLTAGRVPNSDALNLPLAGVATDVAGFIRVNDKLETTAAGIFALGDVKGGPAFTHISYDDFRILRTNLIEKGSASIAGRILPYTVFIDPELGRIGLSESEAKAQGRAFRVAKMPMAYVARAAERDETRGFMKALVDPATGRILGATILGIEGGEMMSQIELAMMGGLPYTALRDAVFAHPTLAESWNNLFTHFQE